MPNPFDDAAYEAERERVYSCWKKWVNAVGLGYWHHDVIWYRDDFPDRPNNRITIAQITAIWEYQKTSVEFSLLRTRDLDEDELQYTVLHELCHALVNEMREFGSDTHVNRSDAVKHEERTVTHLAKAFGWVYAMGKEDAKCDTETTEKN